VRFAPHARSIEASEPGPGGSVNVRVAWFYRPEEAVGGRKAFHSARELFRSDHRDVVGAASILGRCRVLDLRAFQALPAPADTDYFYRFSYRAAAQRFLPRRVPVFCLCEMPYNPDLLMLECMHCAEWYHPECVGLERVDASAQRAFVCPECAAAGAGAEPGGRAEWELPPLKRDGGGGGGAGRRGAMDLDGGDGAGGA
jgi:hypothetical protein